MTNSISAKLPSFSIAIHCLIVLVHPPFTNFISKFFHKIFSKKKMTNMQKEIFEQPDVLRGLLKKYLHKIFFLNQCVMMKGENMSYINANDILPKELINEIQKYVQGVNLYIPKIFDKKKTDSYDIILKYS